MTESTNPYQPPEGDIQPPQPAGNADDLLASPRTVGAARGASWVSEAWPLFSGGIGIWIGMTLIASLISMALSMVPLLGIAAGLLMPFFMAGWAVGCERMRVDGEVRFEDLFAGFSEHFAPLAIAGVIYLAANLVAMLIAGGLMAITIGGAFALGGMGADAQSAVLETGFIIGILLGSLVTLAISIPVIMLIWFAPTLIVLNNVAPVDALKMSFMGCLKNILPFLLYGVVTLAMVIGGMLALLIGLLFVIPWIACSNYSAYRDIYVGDPA